MCHSSLALITVIAFSAGSVFGAGAPAASTTATDSAPLKADTPQTTVLGNTFIAPEGWTVRVRGQATILTVPEADSWLALVDVPETEARDAEAAVKAAWAAYKPEAKWPLKVTTDQADRHGWSKQRTFEYQTSPNERRDVVAATK